MTKIPQTVLILATLLSIVLCPAFGFSLESTGKQAGKDAGRLFNNSYKSEGNIDNKLNKPLTQDSIPLNTLDSSKSGDATTFCGTGEVQDEKIALQVRVFQSGSYYYVYTYSDTNNDGVLDSTRSFLVSKTCLDGYQYGSSYYKWTVSSTGYVSTVSSAALSGCMDPLTNPPTYVGGTISQLYAGATGRTITNSSFTGDTVVYYTGQVRDCSNNTQDIAATQYYSNPYKMNDGAIAMIATCNSSDPACQAYQATQSAGGNVSTSSAGTYTCTVTRNVINAQGPQNGIICEANKVYYANAYSNGICYKTSGSTWDYNAGFLARCDSYGKNLTLEGWASWEGAPCGIGADQTANWPPQPQIEFPLTYGGSASSVEIGQLSINRRMCGSNCAYNDMGGDTRCVTDVTPVRAYLSRSCSTNNVTCNYNISVVNSPACPSYVVAVTAPTGENIDNQCASYEEQNCALVDEWWYPATGSPVQTVKNGMPTNTYPSSTCRTFSALGSVCKDWWSKSRTYNCGGANKYNPDVSRAAEVMNTADNSAGGVTYDKSPFNTEYTRNCIMQIDLEFPYTSAADCTALGGTVRCPPGFVMDGDVCIGSPVCPQNSHYNPDTDYCEAPVVPQCLDAGFVYNPTTRMCEDEPSCLMGTFNPSADRCEATPNPTCQSGFTYNPATQTCQMAGFCGDGNYNASTHLCEAAPFPDCDDLYFYNSSTNKCEMVPQCTQGAYNPGTNECEYTPQPSCPNNYDYDAQSQTCLANPICLVGNYNPSTDLCEYVPDPHCPPDFTYNGGTVQCQDDPECLLSATYDSSLNVCFYNPAAICPTGYTFETSRSQCEDDPDCSSGTYNAVRDYCEKNRVNSCPTDYTYSPTYNVCQLSPPCPSPGAYNTSYNECRTPKSLECPSGMTYVSARNRCEVAPPCTLPFAYNTSRNRCEKPADHICTSPYTYNSSRAQCETAAVCPAPSVFVASHDKCEKAPENQCEPGFTYDPGISNCVQPPGCESPSVYDTVDNRCEKTADNYCEPGLTYDGSAYCQVAPPCEAGAAYNTSTNRCEMPATAYYVCPGGGNYSDPAVCQNNCPATAACSNTLSSLSVTSNATAVIDTITTSVNTMTFQSGAATVTTIASNSGNLSFSGGPGAIYRMNKIWCYGNQLVFYDGAAQVGSVTLEQGQCYSNTSVTCSSGYIGRITPYGAYGFYIYNSGGSYCGYMLLNTYVCPAGNYACNGTPGTCSYNQTCTTGYTCPSGYTLSGSICYKSVACPSGTTLNTTYDLCRKNVTRCLGTGFTYTSTYNLCYKSATCPTGSTLSTSWDTCYMSPTRCLDGYTYSSTYGVCQLTPPCEAGGTYSTSYDICYKADTDCSAGTYYSTYDLCYMSAICPGASFLDTSYDVCYQSAANVCPTDYTYSSTYDLCRAAVACPSGGALQTSRDKCEIVSTLICDDDFTWNSLYGICQKPAICSDGYLDTSIDRCVVQETYDCTAPFLYANNRCENAPVCHSGSVMDGNTDKCELAPTYTCEDDYIFNAALTLCQKTPSCYSPGVFDSAIDECRADYFYYCDAGFFLDAGIPLCHKPPDCPSGGVLNGAGDVCENNMFYSCSESDYVYNSSTGFCEGNPDCTMGTFSTSSYLCEIAPTFCENGYAFDQPAWICHKPPSCTTGTYNASADKCEADPRFCPADFQYHDADFICRSDASCTPGTLDISTDKCESDPRCEKTENKEFACVYDNPTDHTGLHCDDSSYPVQTYEVRRKTIMECKEMLQCNVSCIVSVPDGSGGYTYEQRACSNNGNDTYTCPNGSYAIAKPCGCIIGAFDPNEVKETDCTVSCMVVSPNSNPGGNVTNDYIIKECAETIIGGAPSYTCPVSGAEYIYQDCGCIDSFGLPAGVIGALIEGIRDKECIP